MPAKPPMGQHWLNHRPSLAAMVAAAELRPGERVLEIGTGLGYLTDELLKSGARVFSLEYDADLCRRNAEKYAAAERLQLLQGDIRRFDWTTLEPPFKICANIPYYLSAYLLRQLSDLEVKPTLAALLLDAGDAAKIAAAEKRTLLAVVVQSHYEVSSGETVAAGLFQPPPKVTSQIATLRRRPAFSGLRAEDWPRLVRLFKACFSSRRKQIGVNLRAFLRAPKEEVATILANAGIAFEQRAEELTDEQWWRLFVRLRARL